MMSTLEAGREELIGALQQCATASEHCATTAIGMRDKEACVRACRDTVSLCRVAAELVARRSTYAVWVIPASILAAQECAVQCELQLGTVFEECAQACRTVVAAADKIAEANPAKTAEPGKEPDSESGLRGWQALDVS
jgi:hypothetical protein